MALFKLVAFVVAAFILKGCESVDVSPAKITNHPYVVSVRSFRNVNEHLCTGTIINRNYVLTTATCAKYERLTHIVAGIQDLRERGTKYNIQKVSYHPYYDKFSIRNSRDIYNAALLKLTESIRYTFRVQSILLEKRNYFDYKNAVYITWGYPPPKWNYNIRDITTLKKAAVRKNIPQSCEIYQPHSTICSDRVQVFCNETYGGGPLVNRQNRLIGFREILPFEGRDYCHYQNFKYTNITYLVPWIEYAALLKL